MDTIQRIAREMEEQCFKCEEADHAECPCEAWTTFQEERRKIMISTMILDREIENA